MGGETGGNVDQPDFLNEKDAAEDREQGKKPRATPNSDKKKEQVVEESVKNAFRH